MLPAPIMEPFDAQMIDYPLDTDVHMHTTVSSPRPQWTLTEATMEFSDDIQPISTDPIEDVEIDMEPYYTAGPEYEMLDENDYVPSGGDPDLVDVDVRDAPEDIDAPPASPNPPLVPEPVASDAHVAFSGVKPPDVEHPHDLADPDTSHVAASLPPPLPSPQHRPDILPLENLTEVLDVHHTLPPDEKNDPDAAQYESDNEAGAPLADARAALDAGEEHLSPADPAVYIGQSTAEDGAESPERHPAPDHTQKADDETKGEQPEPASESDASGDYPDQAFHRPDAGHNIEDHKVHYEGDPDPHEISEGVYIEPPPPVLLDLPFSSATTSFCLFNAPDQSSTHLEGDEKTVYTTLLHQQPTLYYERLLDVFEALRQEDDIKSIPEFWDGELVLDAYDLQLVISEDNVYAREVTLHDLNVLHDGSDLAGPLRISLRSVVPRFIHRYHSLRDQITRLNFVDEGGVAHGASSELEDLTIGTTSLAAVVLTQDVQETSNDNQDEQGNTTHEGQQPAERPDAEAAVDLQDQPDEYREVYGRNAETLGQDDEYEDTTFINEQGRPTAALDADTTHPNDSTATGGETTEFQEALAPDDDEDGQVEYPGDNDETEDPEPLGQWADLAAEEDASDASPSGDAGHTVSNSAPDAEHTELQPSNIPHVWPSTIDAPDDLSGSADGFENNETGGSTSSPAQSPSVSLHGTIDQQKEALQLDDTFYTADDWDEDDQFDPDIDEPHDEPEGAASAAMDGASTDSSTLSSKASTKRTLEEADLEENEDSLTALASRTSSPGSKRARVT
ncbi:hypothetical protein FA95DRAFT_1605415 [Auriscalpium vulgare]|uniref:Uncharacterized protein n=1 Tax=Auriscalpium vulgare TaxID=40419 RepID=A0ACB8RWK9_9AGAM|nr:hypothetical protein FA95DRAFT_1605415 [Auriscalpium vulgare]